MTRQEYYTATLREGCALEIGKISLCCMNNYYTNLWTRKPMFQVHCDHYKEQSSELYDNIEDAVLAFMKLKKRLYGNRMIYV